MSLGQYVSPGTPIVPLSQWNPVHVDFTVPQSALGQIHTGQTVRFKVDADPGKHFKATISAINSEVNAGTRNVTLRATAKNPHHLLRPGMFARLQVLTGKPKKVVVVPQSAITYSTFGDYVYKVARKSEHGHKRRVAVQQPVRTGSSRGKWVVIASGLKAGVTVVTHGQIKLHNGMPVKPKSAGAG
ncbi:MAG: efflux RND transporter periplasmic adaptor subunit [Gammaproteobacteria bacterium]